MPRFKNPGQRLVNSARVKPASEFWCGSSDLSARPRSAEPTPPHPGSSNKDSFLMYSANVPRHMLGRLASSAEALAAFEHFSH